MLDHPWILLLLTLIITTPLLWWFTHTIVKPITNLQKAANSVALGNFKVDNELANHGPSELREVGQSFNKMSIAIDNLISNQHNLLSSISHELKTPLAIISSNTDVLELEHGNSKWTKNIQNQVERLTSLVNSLVAFSRMEEKDTVERVKFDLTSTLKSRINDFNELANFQKKFITTDIDSNLYYNGDQQATIQLMDILLENAIKYAPQNSDINISLKKNRRYATMKISNKANVKKGDLRKVFDRFYRLDESRNSHVKGYGIGLSMAQVIAEKHKEVIKAYAPEDGIFSIETRFTLDEKK